MKKVFILLVVIVVVVGVYVFVARQKEMTPLPAGILDLTTVRVGDQFGVWTVTENTVKEKTVTDHDTNQEYTGLEGHLFFDGTLTVHGSYTVNELSGGIILYIDKEYEQYLPVIVGFDKNENLARHGAQSVPIALFKDLAHAPMGQRGELTVEIKHLRYQAVWCLGCDPWQGFYVDTQLLDSQPAPVGGERDGYGCLSSAGYTFDQRVGACTRGWELTDDIAAAAKVAVERVGTGYALTVVSFNAYEEPGAYDIMFERGEERTPDKVTIRNWQVVE